MRYIYTSDGNVAATVDSSGRVTLGTELGAIVGLARDSDVFADELGGDWIGRVDTSGHITDARFQPVGSIDKDGRILDPTGRLLGKAEKPVDGAVLILLIGSLNPEVISGPSPPASNEATIMDEVLELSQGDALLGARKNFKPLTDADVYGEPFKPPKK